jgi:outer membrane protein assembly factor BamB
MANRRLGRVTRWAVMVGCIVLMSPFMGACQKQTRETSEETTLEAPIEEVSQQAVSDDALVRASIDDLPSPVAAPDDWPWWRGPTSNNHAAPAQDPPTQWSDTENVLWQVNLPGKGHATPCVQGERIFVPAGDKEQQTIWMLCLERASGQRQWQKAVYQGKMPKIHGDNSHASAMPACDGQRVFFPYQTDEEIRMVALNLEGDILWDESVSPYSSIQGFSASPILYRSAVIVPISGKDDNRLTALHRGTGQIIWQTEVAADHESYASAVLAEVAGRKQVILVGPDNIRTYDPDTGRKLWECDGPAQCYVAVAVADEKTVYATGGYPKKALLAIAAHGSGNVTDTHLTWKSDNKAGYVSSPLLHEGLLYAVNDRGLFRCYEAATGEVLWEEQLEGKFYSSPVLVHDMIYLFNRTGQGFVLRTGRTYKRLAENTLAHGIFATPVICRSHIFLRTLDTFYCLAR